MEDFYLNRGERLVRRAKISKMVVLMIWGSVPAVALVWFLSIYLPQLIRYTVNAQLRAALLQSLGEEDVSFFQLFSAVRGMGYSSALAFLPDGLVSFLKGFMVFAALLIVLVWFIWACAVTSRTVQYSLVYTNLRVVARTRTMRLEAEPGEITDVRVEQSFWGKIFHYGDVTVRTERQSITVCNVCLPDEIAAELQPGRDK